MSLDKLKAKVKGKLFGGVFVFCGQEEYTKDYYASVIRKAVVEEFPEFNHVVLNMNTSTLSDLNEACSALPFMSDQKLIEIKELNVASLSEEDAQLFSAILRDLPGYCTVLMLYRNGEPGEKPFLPKEKNKAHIAALVSEIAKLGCAVVFDYASPAELQNWLVRHFNAQKLNARENAVRKMIDMCGVDMYILHSELEKLCAACSDKGEVTAEDVELYCCANESYAIYDLSGYVIAKNFKKAHEILNYLLESKLQPTQILAVLAKRFSELMLVKSAVENAVPHAKIAADLKLGDWLVKKYINSAAALDSDYFSFVIKEVYQTDIKMKSSAEDKNTVLKMLIARVAAYEG